MARRKRRRKLTVRRKGYYVKPTTYKRKGKLIHRKGYWVKPTTYKIRDRGRPGRGPKKIKISRPGSLKKLGYDPDIKAAQRRKALRKAVKRYGYKSTISKLVAVRNLTKNTDRKRSKIYRSDIRYLQREFGRR